MSDPRELLDRLDALHAAATPGPWQVEHARLWGGTTQVASMSGSRPWASDANMIVAAVNALPALTAALRAVLDLHLNCGCPGSVWDSRCYRCQNGGHHPIKRHPCPTVKAITDSLGEIV